MAEEKKVLIIAYYWPPSGGSGVQRWLKFVKYLPQFGVEPFVFTPENPAFATRDESLLHDVPPEAEVIRFPIWEPYDIFFRLSNLFNSKKTMTTTHFQPTKQSAINRLATWLRGNLFIPDPRVFWVRPSVRFLEDFIIDNKIRTIITTGPPHSMHLIGLGIKKKLPSIKWIADFRDPWSEWGLLDSLRVGILARKAHKRLEAKVLASADTVVTITPFYVNQFKALAQRKIKLLTNGFDEDDFKAVVIKHNAKFLIRHVGIVNEKCDPRPFMQALQQMLQTDEAIRNVLRVEFIGEVHPRFKNDITSDKLLNDVTIFTGNVPHKELLGTYGDSALLLLILTGYKDAAGFLPGKLFEYIATGLPVLGVGPVAGDAASLLKESEAGVMIDSHDADEIIKVVTRHYENWLTGDVHVQSTSARLKYSRKETTKQLVELL